MADWEKKMNKIFLDFIIGGNYLSDGFQNFFGKIKKVLIDMYNHLMVQWCKILKRWDED